MRKCDSKRRRITHRYCIRNFLLFPLKALAQRKDKCLHLEGVVRRFEQNNGQTIISSQSAGRRCESRFWNCKSGNSYKLFKASIGKDFQRCRLQLENASNGNCIFLLPYSVLCSVFVTDRLWVEMNDRLHVYCMIVCISARIEYPIVSVNERQEL